MLTVSGRADEVPWPEDAGGAFARAWLEPLLREPVEARIANVRTRLEVAVADGVAIPLTVGAHVPGNSYVSSPFAHYVAYAREELDKLGNPPLEWVLDKVVALLGGWLLRCRFDDVVYVNNWLLSTNLYPALGRPTVEALHGALLARHPEHALVWRSVDATGNPELLGWLDALGYRRLFSRIVWYQDASDPALARHRNLGHDTKLLRRSGYEVVDALADEDFERVRELYDALYLHKYSEYNPAFSSRWLRELSRAGLLSVRGLRKEGRIDGVFGYYVRRGFGTAPVFGYDTALPQELGLYRMLSAAWFAEARERGLRIHASAGVGSFKKTRGAVPVIEYSLVHDAHLPAWRRRPWGVLQQVLDRIAVPMISRLEL